MLELFVCLHVNYSTSNDVYALTLKWWNISFHPKNKKKIWVINELIWLVFKVVCVFVNCRSKMNQAIIYSEVKRSGFLGSLKFLLFFDKEQMRFYSRGIILSHFRNCVHVSKFVVWVQFHRIEGFAGTMIK